MSHVMNTYARQPVAFVRGEGVWLWDEAGKEYLDALAGIAVNTLGYGHPRLKKALIARIESGVLHTSNLWRIPDQEKAADRVAEITGLDEVFFCNSGLEATEASIKVARKYGHDRGVAEPAIIVMEKASMAARSPRYQPPAAARCKPGSSRSCRVSCACRSTTSTPCARWRSTTRTWRRPGRTDPGRRRHQCLAHGVPARGLKEICERKEWLFISDEVQCGLGRTGKWFVYQHASFQPTSSRSPRVLLPACRWAPAWSADAPKGSSPGNHGSTFGGNPLAMTAVITTIDTIKDEGLLANARAGPSFRKAPKRVRLRRRGPRMGLMIGVELGQPCGNSCVRTRGGTGDQRDRR